MSQRIDFWVIKSDSRGTIWKHPFKHKDQVDREYQELIRITPTDGKPKDWKIEAHYSFVHDPLPPKPRTDEFSNFT